MSVFEATQRDLKRLPRDLAGSALAAAALALAESVDDPGTRPTAKALVAKELRETMVQLRALAPPATKQDRIDELHKRRQRRRGATSKASVGP